MEQRIEKQEVEQAPKETEKKITNPVLRMELTIGTIALGLFIDLVVSGPGGMFSQGGAPILALFAFLTAIAYEAGVDIITWFQKIKQEWAPYLPGGEQEQVVPQGEDRTKTRVLAPPVEQEYWERVEKEIDPMPPLPMKGVSYNHREGNTTAILSPSSFSFDTRQAEAPVFPPTTEEDTIRWGTVYGTKSRFDPDFDRIFGQGIIIAAAQASGKSHIFGRTIEQAAKGGIPAIIFDHKGEYHTISEHYQSAIRVGGTPNCKLVLTEEHEPQMGQLIAALFEERLQLIIDLPTYGPRWSSRARIIAMVTRSLMSYAEEQRLCQGQLFPCLVLLDEAQLYLPENGSLLPPEAAQDSRGVLPELKNAFFAMVSNGRSNGYTVGFATQSLTYIAKWAIKSCQIHIYGRHVEKNDLDRIEDEIDDMVATREDIKAFDKGVAIVTGLTREPVIVQFDRKESRDLSETPSLKRLRSTTTTTNLDAYLTTYQQPQPPVVTMAPRYQPPVVEQPVVTPTMKTGVLSRRLSPELQAVLDVYKPGMNYRELGEKLGVNKDTAGKRLGILKARGFIN